MKTLDVIVGALLIIGGLNWGLVGFFQFDLVAAIFGEMSLLTRVVYAVVGVCALYELLTIRGMRRRWALPSPHRATPATGA
jgi:uncharacterized membrane protein YuzA (DUF378 family)